MTVTDNWKATEISKRYQMSAQLIISYTSILRNFEKNVPD